MPSNIEKMDNGFYRTSCSCSSDEHNLTYDITLQKDYPYMDDEVEFSMYVKGFTGDYEANIDYNDDNYFLKCLWWRIKKCVELLWKGEVSSDYIISFRDKEHIREFATSILNELNK